MPSAADNRRLLNATSRSGATNGVSFDFIAAGFANGKAQQIGLPGRVWLRGWPGAALLALAVMMSLAASNRALAVCEPQEGPRFTDEIADRFMQDPRRLLRQDNSAYGLSVFIMQFSAARSRNLDIFKSILPNADRRQRAAIGVGFARAVTFCQLADGAIADRIAKWVTKLPVHDIVGAYQQAMASNGSADSYSPVEMVAPKVEDRFGGGLNLLPAPNASGVGNLKIPDPTSLPGD